MVFNNGTGIPSAGAAKATVATSQTTTSGSYTDLATAGPAVTITIGSTGLVLVSITSRSSNTNAVGTFTGFAVSGANTVAAADTDCFLHAQTSSVRASYTTLLSGLVAGSTTFTMKYKVSANTGTFLDRTITVVPL